MARLLLVEYTLHGLSKNYRGLKDTLEELPVKGRRKILDSSWLLVTDLSPGQVLEALRPSLGVDDELLVVSLKSEGAFTGFRGLDEEFLKALLPSRGTDALTPVGEGAPDA